MSDARETRLNLTRAILRNEKFLAMNNAEQRAVLDSLLARGLTKQDLKMLLAEKHNEESDPFRILDKPILTKILLSLDPEDVISSCTADKRYANVCSDPSTFQQLLAAHYPDAFFTDNPRQQYLALTRGVESFYRMDRIGSGNSFQFTNPTQIGKSRTPESTPGWSFANVDEWSLSHMYMRPNYAMRSWLQKHFDTSTHKQLVKVFDELLTLGGVKSSKRSEEENLRSAELKTILAERLDRLVKNALETDRKNTEHIFRDYIYRAMPKGYLPDDKFDYIWGYRPDAKRHDLIFRVAGNSVPRGTHAWLYLYTTLNMVGRAPVKISLFKTREEMARDFISKQYEPLVNGLIEDFTNRMRQTYGDNFDEVENIRELDAEGIVKLNDFIALHRTQGFPILPLSRENMYQYIMTHNELQDDPTNTYAWIFRLVTF